jgi:hypothetical protein
MNVQFAAMNAEDELAAIEQELWNYESRYDTHRMDQLLAPDFFEFGKSGRRYTRGELLLDKQDQRDFIATLHKFSTKMLSPSVALVTYAAELTSGSTTEWSNRSSIWDNSLGKWQLRFHQGTALPPELVANIVNM